METVVVYYILAAAQLISIVSGHGYLTNPPSRNAMWRFGFKTEKNYNDNEQNCGGFSYQWDVLSGACGVCGDRFDDPNPSHVYPGRYASGTIGRTYIQGEVIDIDVRITAQHQGWFEFRIGQIRTPPITQQKLTYLLPVVGQNGDGTRFYFPSGSGTGKFSTKVKLPDELFCDHCVLQWWWNVGNSYGCDATGCGIGKGKQETFVNCADVSIRSSSGATEPPRSHTTSSGIKIQTSSQTQTDSENFSPTTSGIKIQTSSQSPTDSENSSPTTSVTISNGQTFTTAKPPSTVHPLNTTTGSEVGGQNYVPVDPWRHVPGINGWCKRNCPRFCPGNYCVLRNSTITNNCRAAGEYRGQSKITNWCKYQCPLGFCPESHCECD